MVIPTAMVNLNETDAPFGQPSCQQAVGSVGARNLCIRTVEIERVLRFVADVGQVGNRSLHSIRHFIGGNTSVNLRVADRFTPQLIHLGNGVEKTSTIVPVGSRGIIQVKHRVTR